MKQVYFTFKPNDYDYNQKQLVYSINTKLSSNIKTMKKALFTLSLCIFSIQTYSQISKGTILLGGSSTISYNSEEGTVFSIYPASGLFLTNKFCLGVDIPIIQFHDKFFWGFSSFGRYYFHTVENKSYFIEGTIGISSIFINSNELGTWPISIGVGHVWFLNKSIGFEPKMEINTNFYSYNIGLLLGFHMYYHKEQIHNSN